MLGRRRGPTVSSVEESWSVSQGTYDDRPLLARFNAGYARATDRSDYGIQIGVAVPVNSPDERGWPSGDENQQLQAIETEVTRAVGDRAVLVGVLTVNGVRELVLYAREGDWIEQFHHQLQRATVTHEVQVMARRDPDWAVFDQFAKSP